MPSLDQTWARRAGALAIATLACIACGCEQTRAAPPEKTGAAHPSTNVPAAAPAAPESHSVPLMSESLSDSAITARVQAGLARDPALAGSDISVNTDHGVVSLTGRVRSQEQIAIAAAHAQAEDGVMRIDDHLALNAQ